MSDESLTSANILTGAFEPKIDHPVHLYDETLRDGEQTVGVAFSPEQKIEIARRLLDTGLTYMSLGFPAVSEVEERIAKTIATMGDSSRFYCFARAKRQDVESVLRCNVPNIIMFVATSDCHLQSKLKMTVDEAYGRMQEQIKFAVDHGLGVRFAFEDASRTPLERLKTFTRGAIEAGATMITFADTAGVMTPASTEAVIRELKAITKSVPIMVHMHNDLGLATANSIVALGAGATFVSGALGGMGERAGNAPLEEVLTILRVKYGIDLGIDLAKFAEVAKYVTEVAKFPVSPSKPIIGDNAFAHESGIHVHGLLGNPATYEAFPPALVGRAHEIHFGKHSGLSNVRYVADKHGLSVDNELLEQTLKEVKRRGMSGEPPSEEDILDLLRAR